MKDLSYTLITDGSSDKTLIPIINWVLDQIPGLRYTGQYAEYTHKASAGLLRRVEAALRLYECDILFVHRDAEAMSLDKRIAEIHTQLQPLAKPYIPVVPIRMTEAWLLIDEKAIRSAANNPNGKTPLKLPAIGALEQIADPKTLLFDALKQASELPQRRLANFQPASARHRVAELIDDFMPLRKLSAFTQFEADLRQALNRLE